MPATEVTEDPFPFAKPDGYNSEEFVRSALYNGPSENASKQISKIELLKDTRPMDGHWRHEFLVFSVNHEEQGLYLYCERHLFEPDETWMDMAVFAWKLFQGDALDLLTFFEPGCEKDVETKSFAKTIFQINLRSSFTLKDLAKILGSVSYKEKYPKYDLFSANCWAWARGFLFDIIFNSRIANTSEVLKTNGREMVPITVEEMKLYMLTEYGAYGRLLLHFSSDDYISQSRTKAFPESLNRYGIRIILLLYSILRPLVRLKDMIIGPSNWTICLRKLFVYHYRTLENSTKGPDCTFLPLHPNFIDLIPVIPGHMDYALPSSFCQPGKYLYLLSSPVCSSSQPVWAVHVYVFGAIYDVPIDGDTFTWLSCGIIRRSKDNGELIEVASSHVRLITSPRGIIQGSSPVEYSMIRVFNSDEDFTKEIRHGDMIALWAHSYRGQLHTPRLASIKVVVSRRPVRMIDWILASFLLFEIGRFAYLGGSYTRLAFSAIGYLLYWTNSYCEGWLWSNLSAFARTIHASATPLSFPTDMTSKHNYILPAFLQEPITADIFSAQLHSIELFQEKSGKEIILATFSHQRINYVIHFIGPSAVNAGWLHYFSFLTTAHRLEQDEVKIFREGETERTVRESYEGQSILMIRFKAGENPGTEPTTLELELRSIVRRLQRVQRHYWWYFWLNSRYWTWQWWLLNAALHETAGVQEFIEVEGRPCSREEAAILLNAKYRQWRHASMKEYDRGLPRLNDVLFVITQARSIWIILIALYSSWLIHPKVHSVLVRFFPFLDI